MTDVGALSPAKRALFEAAMRRRAGAAAAATIPRRTDTGPAPLSYAQHRMWFLQQWEPDAPTFNGVRAVRLRGALDAAALKRAFELVLERHESLRTVFVGEGEPVAVALEDYSFELPLIKLPEAHTAARLRELAREPFDLSADLMMRATLIEETGDQHVLLMRIHHIAADAHSDGILFGELSEIYDALVVGREPQLAELPIQYADYAVWQRQRLTGQLLEQLIAYWRRQLDGAPPLLRLPTDGPRPPVQRHAGAHRRFALQRSLVQPLLELSRHEGATFYITMLAAFATLLYLASGEDDLVIGSPIASRNNLELQGLIGFFTNTIALRIGLAGNPTFREVVRRTKATAMGAYAHQELPFEKVVEAVAPKRDPSFNPLFQVNFRAHATQRPALSFADLEATPVPVDIGFSRFDFALELELSESALSGYFEYDQDLFDASTVDGFIADLELVLNEVGSDPDRPILAISPAQRRAARTATPGGTITRRR